MRYNVGLYGGTFSPLHLGHVDCILQAAAMCRELHIIISIGNHRQEVDPLVRYRWIYTLTKHIGNVQISFLEDNADTKEGYTEDMWLSDAARIKKEIGKPVDIVFCGSDYVDGGIWRKCYPESVIHVFERNEISSTALRSDLYGHWDWLPQVVRPYYTKRVLLMGGESTGKSTLTINLAHYFNAAYIDEAGRDLSEKSGTDMKMLSEDFTEILLQQKMNEIHALEQGPKILFEDTDALVTSFYMHFLEDPQLDHNRALADAIDGLNRYDLILFLEPDVDFVQDGDRSTVIAADRRKYSDQIKDLLHAHGKEFVTIEGDYVTRYRKAIQEVKKILEQSPFSFPK